MKALYIAYGIFEIVAGAAMLFGGISLANQFTPGLELNSSASHFVTTFGAAIISIGVISFLALKIKDLFAKKAISFTFAFYNCIAVYTNWFIPPVPGQFNPPLIIHLFFALAFIIHFVRLTKEEPTG